MNSLFFSELGYLEAISLVYFLGLVFFALGSEYKYWLVLPLAILTTPNAINDFFPAQLMGPYLYGDDVPSFSVVTHIDIYFLVGLLVFARAEVFSAKWVLSGVALLLSVCCLYLFGFWFSESIYGLYQVRYLFFAVLLVFVFRNVDYFPYFSKGFFIAVVLVLCEAVVFTFVGQLETLQSGNFGKNPLGHLFAASIVFGLVVYFFFRSNFYLFFAVVLSVALVFNATRAALLVLGVCLIIFGFLFFVKQGRFFRYVVSIFPVLYALFMTSLATYFLYLDWLYVEFEVFRTDFNTSLMTRLATWVATLGMSTESMFFGFGPGSWAFLKDDFLPVRYARLLDPHNDYINLIFSYGYILGFALYFVVFVKPIKLGCDGFRYKLYALSAPCVFIFSTFLSGFSNSVFWKHQITALVCLFSAHLFFYHRNQLQLHAKELADSAEKGCQRP